MTLIDILIAAIVLVVVIYVVKLGLDMLELPPPIRSLVMLVVAVVVILVLLSWLGVGGNLTTRQLR